MSANQTIPGQAVDISSAESFLKLVGQGSRFWLPPFLDDMARVASSLMDADGCSIFLIRDKIVHEHPNGERRLYLAATTRQKLRPLLFREYSSYSINPDELREAARQYLDNKTITASAGTTGWVAAFNRCLRLPDLTIDEYRKGLVDEQAGVPFPVWSDRLRGHRDSETEKRPFLVVPMRHDGQVLGVIRVYTDRPSPHEFTEDDETLLVDFGSRLARLLSEHLLLGDGAEHYFRIWAAPDGHVLAQTITDAVPRLFASYSFTCCSFFQRDSQNRFILRNASAVFDRKRTADDKTYHADIAHFNKFKHSIGRIYYDGAEGAKTSLCVQSQDLVWLVREAHGWTWTANGRNQVHETPKGKSGKSRTVFPDDQPDTHEFDPTRSKTIVLVPVRDVVNSPQLAGIIRAVSTEPLSAQELVTSALRQFADPLAQKLGESVREELQRDTMQKLIDQIPAVHSYSTAAEIIATAINADSVTIFRYDRSALVAADTHTYLNVDQIQRDSPIDQREKLPERQEHHRFWSRALAGGYSFPVEKKRLNLMSWSLIHKRTLKVKDVLNRGEMAAVGLEASDVIPFEIRDPGPFMVAPMVRGSEYSGVIRAVRSRASRQGSFSLAHELIFSSCASLLAGVTQLWARRTCCAAISFSGMAAMHRDQLVRFLSLLGVKWEHSAEETGDSGREKFKQSVSKATVGIVLCMNSQDGQLSQNVGWETGVLQNTLGVDKVVIIRHSDCTIPEMARGSYEITFGERFSFTDALIQMGQWIMPYIDSAAIDPLLNRRTRSVRIPLSLEAPAKLFSRDNAAVTGAVTNVSEDGRGIGCTCKTSPPTEIVGFVSGDVKCPVRLVYIRPEAAGFRVGLQVLGDADVKSLIPGRN